MLVYTSVTRSYLPKARVLAESLKRQHPDWEFAVLLADVLPDDWDAADWPFDHVVLLPELGFPNWRGWTFAHSVVELCTAVKGRGALVLIERLRPEKILYLDPDIRVYGSLAPLADLLDEHAVLLTPHLLDPESTHAAIVDAEVCTLKHGVYNLGFYAARTTGQGRAFIEWWADRLTDYCIADIPGGLFTDQRWCDLAPCFFDRLHIVRDRGCNVATWNVYHRRITRTPDGVWMAGDVPLRFYHFTGYDSGDGMGMLRRYAADQPAAFALWEEYGAELKAAGHGRPAFNAWEYGRFSNGEPVTAAMRRLYRARPDLQEAFPNPYEVAGQRCFLRWWHAEGRACSIEHAQPAGEQGRQSLSLGGPRAGGFRRAAPWLFVAAAVAMVVLAVVGVVRHFSIVPLWDIWGGGLHFFLESADLRAWWAPHNEHRIVLPRVLFWLDYRLLGGTGLPLVACTYAMLGIFAALWISLLKGADGLARDRRVCVAGFLVAWCFQWMQNGNMVWPFQVQFLLAYLVPLLSLLALGRSADKKRDPLFHAAVAGGVLSAGTMANGLLALPLLTALAAALRMSRLRVVGLAALTCAIWAAYCHGLTSLAAARTIPAGGDVFRQASSFLCYVLLFLGSPFFHLVGGDTGLVVGIAAGGVACAAAGWLARRVFTQAGGARGVDAALVFFAAYVIISGLAIGWGRFQTFGLEQAATFRYTTPAIMLWAALVCGVLRCGAVTRFANGRVALVLLLLGELLILRRQVDAVRWPRDHVFQEAVGGLALSFGARDDDAIAKVYPEPGVVAPIAARARAAGLAFFRLPPFSVAVELQDWRGANVDLPSCPGAVERVAPVGDDGRYERLDGWAVVPGGERPSWGRVVDRDGRVVGAVVCGGTRPDLTAAHGSAGRTSGFSGYMLAGTRPFTVILMARGPLARIDSP